MYWKLRERADQHLVVSWIRRLPDRPGKPKHLVRMDRVAPVRRISHQNLLRIPGEGGGMESVPVQSLHCRDCWQELWPEADHWCLISFWPELLTLERAL